MEDRQFRQRLESWQKELKNHLMTPIAPVDFSGCTTFDRIRHQDAAALPFAPMPVGTEWGGYREYAWFTAQVTLPPQCTGQRVVFTSGLGGEQLVYVDGVARGSIDKEHFYVTLFREAPAQASVTLLIESYAGHGARLENSAPIPPEKQAIPPTPDKQCCIAPSGIAVFNEDAYQLYMDVQTLMELWRILPGGSVRWQQVDRALRDFTHTADFELDYEGRNASFRAARAKLQAALSATNGSSAPVLNLVGQSHIDLAWLWPLEETYHKVVRTFSNQLHLMEEYPEYRFLACEPILFDMLRESDPEVYDRLVKAVASGQMQPDGAFYVECDTNVPSGESLIRQLDWGKKWFREHFGVESKVAYHPDTFGFSPVLPQLLKGFDVPYFSTQKLLRADPECERFPYQDFIWEGVDGSRVQANSFFNCGSKTNPTDLNMRWEKHRTQQTDIERLFYPFGYGDGGGGADRDTLEFLRREENLEGLPRTEWHSIEEHFELTHDNAQKNVWVGELYLAWHRGTYSSQRKTKQLIRQVEQALHDAELLVSKAHMDDRQTKELLHDAWYTVLLHQFHDICAGCGIRDVHLEAEATLSQCLKKLQRFIAEAAHKAFDIQPDARQRVWINTLPFERREWVTLPDGQEGYVTLPPFGAKTCAETELPAQPVQMKKTDAGLVVENGILRFTLDQAGCVRELMDLRTGFPVQEPGMSMNDFRLYKDVEPIYDAWELSRDYVLDLTRDVHTTAITVVRDDSRCFEARIERMIGVSPSVQTVTLRAGDDKIRFETDVDWHERHKLLKVHFESNMRSLNAIHEMQMCHIERPAHRSNAFAKDRYEVINHHYSALFEPDRGIALFNQAIFGVSAKEGDLALTLLHAPCVPDETCDRGQQHFSFAIGVYDRAFSEGKVTHDGYAYNYAPVQVSGAAAEQIGAWAENAIIETVKPAEDGDGVVLRLWEHRGARAHVTLHLPKAYRVTDCGMQENTADVVGEGDTLTFTMKPFEIKTLRVK